MLVYEFRIVLPISVEEYQVGQLYAVAEASKGETGGGDGVEVLKNEPYTNDKESGQYTHKIYHLGSKVPGWISRIAPKGALEIHEEAWNAYPYCKTVLTNPDCLGKKFKIEIITWHKPDMGKDDNVHLPTLTEDEKKNYQVVHLDIAQLQNQKDYKEDEDPCKFKSTKTGRGPLLEGWQEKLETDTNTPHMCCYKLVKAEFKWFGLQGRVETTIQNFERRLFTNVHRKLFCSLDDWIEMNMEDIRRLEDETQRELDEMRKSGAVKGTSEE